MGQPVQLCFDQLPVAHNNCIATQKCAAVAINTWRLTQVHTGFKVAKISGAYGHYKELMCPPLVGEACLV